MNTETTKLSKCYCFHEDQAYPPRIETQQICGVWTYPGRELSVVVLNCGHAVHTNCRNTAARIARIHNINVQCPNCDIQWRVKLLPVNTLEIPSQADAAAIAQLTTQLEKTTEQYVELQGAHAELQKVKGPANPNFYRNLCIALFVFILGMKLVDQFVQGGTKK